MVAVLSRLAATDGDGFGILESDVDSSNPLIEISLLVPFPLLSTQGFSECRVRDKSLSRDNPGSHAISTSHVIRRLII